MTLSTKFATALLLGALSTNVISSNLFPRGCEAKGYGFDQPFLVLNEQGHQAFYMIQNRSNHTIELEHHETHKDVFMSPSLATEIASGQWAAFASDVNNFYFKCYRKQGSERTLMHCRDALDICQYPRVKFALSNMGNYWVATNKNQAQVIRDATRKGIFLHW